MNSLISAGTLLARAPHWYRSTRPLFSVFIMCGEGICCEVSLVLVWITGGFSNLSGNFDTIYYLQPSVFKGFKNEAGKSKALQKGETATFPVVYLLEKAQLSKEPTHLSHSSAWPQGMAPLLRVFGVSGTMNFRGQGDLRTAYIGKVYT